MKDWEPGDFVALVTAVSGLLALFFSKKGVDAVIRAMEYRRKCKADARAQEVLDAEYNEKGLKFLIRRQDQRITSLEDQLEQARKDHLQCREEFAQLQARCITLENRLDFREGRT